MTKRILVTGSEGFIGRALCKRIVRYKDSYVLFTLDRSGIGSNHFKVDINSEKIETIFNKIQPDIVVHLAGNVSVKFSLENPREDFRVNAMGSLNVIHSALQTNCNNLIYITSGGAIYDPDTPLPITEKSVENPQSPYGLSKLIGEQYLRLLVDGKREWSSLALSNCYGEVTEQKTGVIHALWNSLSSGLTPIVFGDSLERDFIFIDDVVDALIFAIEKPLNQRVHVSSGKSTPIIEVLSKIQAILGTKITPIVQNRIPGDVEKNCLDNSLALAKWGWRPKVDLDKGLSLSLKSNKI